MNITRKQVLLYTLTPQILPRIRNLVGTGFAYIAYFIAMVYSAVNLLPIGHPYTRAENIGSFGIRHAIGEAANNLKLDIKNLDQIILFATILVGIVIVILQVATLIGALFMQPVLAQMPTGFAGFFLTEHHDQDLAFMMMDMVFGVPDLFNSCITGTTQCLDTKGQPVEYLSDLTGEYGWPYPIHHGFHQLLQVYSLGLMVVAVIITIYFIITVILETAESGTPFGKRFNHVWAPIRIVVAFGLLIPVGYGLNSAQYITLYAAKFGSGFATNGWSLFNTTLTNTYLGETQDLVTEPNIPEIAHLLQFMFTAVTCKELENADENDAGEVKAYLVKNPNRPNNNLELKKATSYNSLINFANGDNSVTVRFGIHDPTKYAGYKGNVSPTCGEINFVLTDPRPSGTASPGAEWMQWIYWDTLVLEPWFDPAYAFYYDPVNIVNALFVKPPNTSNYPPPTNIAQQSYTFYQNEVASGISKAIADEVASGGWDIDTNLLQKGWGAAGIWYNKVAELNGAVTSAVFALPQVSRYPLVMEEVQLSKRRNNQALDSKTRFQPAPLAGGGAITYRSRPNADHQAAVMWEAYNYWNDVASSPFTTPTGNAFLDAINSFFGTEGLFSMRKNKDKHPLAQLVGIGRSLVESAVNNVSMAFMVSAGGAISNLVGLNLGGAAAAGSGFIISVAMLGLSMGVLLYYIVPFLPFMYFFFALGGWVKGIFEAMVGVPLWALAHIRIDGQGLPGPAATNGYYIILEIFLRPILTVFGLIASISIFAAMVAVLNDIWGLVTSNITGFDVRSEITGPATESLGDFFRSGIDQFFYTCVYAVIVYIIGLSSFKLVDEIPNSVLRWMGQGTKMFNDSRDPAGGLMNTAYIGSNQITGELGKTATSATANISKWGYNKG